MPTKDASPSQLIDARITELSDWRGEMLRAHAQNHPLSRS